MRLGQVVFSKKGRDKGLPFVVMNAEGEYLWLADGKIRPIEKPKKKKLKHVQTTNTTLDFSEYTQRGLQDADIRKLLKLFQM